MRARRIKGILVFRFPMGGRSNCSARIGSRGGGRKLAGSESKGSPQQPLLLTEEQSSIVDLAVHRMRDLTGNPLLDASDVLVMVAEEYLKDADALARLDAATQKAESAESPKRRIALE